MSAVYKLKGSGAIEVIKDQQQGIPLYARKSRIDGLGCFTSAHISAGQFIAEFTGELISSTESARRRRGRRRYTLCALDEGWDVDGSVGGNCTRYINHCCIPNCEVEIKHNRILIHALRDIQPDEELTVDYQYSYHSNRKLCRCGEVLCRGTINQLQQEFELPRLEVAAK